MLTLRHFCAKILHSIDNLTFLNQKEAVMGMKYVPEAGDVVVFGGQVGVLVPDPLDDHPEMLAFIYIDGDGNTQRVDLDYKNPEFFISATPYTGTTSGAMKVAIAALKVGCRC
jgi:hypothetical protein